MGSLNASELIFDSSRFFSSPFPKPVSKTIGGIIPRSIDDFLIDFSSIQNVSDKITKLNDCISNLHDEMKKIEAFKRELPLCMLLLNDAIARLMEESSKCNHELNAAPVLEEFIPLKSSNSYNSCDENESSKDEDKHIIISSSNENKDITNKDEKMNWIKDLQLGVTDDHHTTTTTITNNSLNIEKPALNLHNNNNNNRKRREEEMSPPTPLMSNSLFTNVKVKTPGRAFMPFKGATTTTPTATNVPVMGVGLGGKEDKKDELPGKLSLSMPIEINKNLREEVVSPPSCGFSSKSGFSRLVSSNGVNGELSLKGGHHQTSRKQRRCWSPELHRRFVSSLEQLGGPKVATPKQIRELMQVDGLTNDEVKSHLQKYRLHTRKSNHGTNSSMALGGGLWMSQEKSGESKKLSNSGSPLGSLQSTEMPPPFGDDCMADEDEYVDRSENHICRKMIGV